MRPAADQTTPLLLQASRRVDVLTLKRRVAELEAQKGALLATVRDLQATVKLLCRRDRSETRRILFGEVSA